MNHEKERTALNPSVAAEGEQPLTNHNASIAEDAGVVNPQPENSGKGEASCLGKSEKNRLKTVSMTDLYNQVYTSRPPIINSLLYPGTYILAGAPKLGKSFLMAQLAYHVSTGTEMWGFQVQKGSVLYLALEDDYRRNCQGSSTSTARSEMSSIIWLTTSTPEAHWMWTVATA